MSLGLPIMRIVKIHFRLKKSFELKRTWKVVTTLRIPTVKNPKQIHIGYMDEEIPISDKSKEKLTNKLRQKWLPIFKNTDVSIDWIAAEQSFQLKIEETNKAPKVMSKSAWVKRVILETIFKCSQNDWRIHPSSLYGITQQSGFSEAVVRKTLLALEKDGLIARFKKEHSRAFRYELTKEAMDYLEKI